MTKNNQRHIIQEQIRANQRIIKAAAMLNSEKPEDRVLVNERLRKVVAKIKSSTHSHKEK